MKDVHSIGILSTGPLDWAQLEAQKWKRGLRAFACGQRREEGQPVLELTPRTTEDHHS